MNAITNTSSRWLSFAKFMGLFLFSVGLSSFAVYRSMSIAKSMPMQEFEKLQKKEAILNEMAVLSNQLRRFENAQRTAAPNINEFEALCQAKSVTLHAKIAGLDTSKTYQNIKQMLDMSDQYAAFIKQSGVSMDQNVKTLENQLAILNQQILDLQMKNLELQGEKQQLQVQMLAVLQPAKGDGSSPSNTAAVPLPKPKPTEPAPFAAKTPAPNQQASTAPAADCQLLFDEYQESIIPFVEEIRKSTRNLRGILDKLGGFFNKNKSEKRQIEDQVRNIEEQLLNLQTL